MRAELVLVATINFLETYGLDSDTYSYSIENRTDNDESWETTDLR